MKTVQARWALTETGWQASVKIAIGADGRIESLIPGAAKRADGAIADLLLPAMPNAHCHAFQYQIAGLTERAGGADDSFWTWRERMYEAVDALDAQRLYDTALQLYRRMRRNGYGSVAEFHYVHKAGGAPLEMAQALIEAARAARLSLLLLPVLYCRGGFDDSPLSDRQQRFRLSLDEYGSLLQAIAGRRADHAGLSLGIAPHSLRGVGADDLARALELRQAIVPDCPVHVHIAEQQAEVEQSIAHLGTTPIRWLCDNAPVDARWVMIHATHAEPSELDLLADRDAVICLCTTTEANLGDGFFNLAHWWQRQGALAIGSDSNVGLDPAEELRWLEYQARLHQRRRTRLVDADCPHPGTSLWRRAVAGGRRAMAISQPGLSVGAPAELLSIRLSDTSLAPDEALDDFIFAQRVTAIDAG
ncbi:MAG: formimidoylglutamate deiminase [Burkholderiaceae bacterium]